MTATTSTDTGPSAEAELTIRPAPLAERLRDPAYQAFPGRHNEKV
jgi:hypothetical protein